MNNKELTMTYLGSPMGEGKSWWKDYKLEIDWLRLRAVGGVNIDSFSWPNRPYVFGSCKGYPPPLTEYKRMKEEYQRIAVEEFNETGGLPAYGDWRIFTEGIMKDVDAHLVNRKVNDDE